MALLGMKMALLMMMATNTAQELETSAEKRHFRIEDPLPVAGALLSKCCRVLRDPPLRKSHEGQPLRASVVPLNEKMDLEHHFLHQELAMGVPSLNCKNGNKETTRQL
eukprot:TRINITY_DN8112_c0_g2_i1.p2 TRINITY_DN8112_c0_g2~~TRINITY_DN8112_c0_g2_i1.p2  ORF type:complete len:108 (+),score=11.89 TRINITY_DN8112_c0_g2_i1:446-769(+)